METADLITAEVQATWLNLVLDGLDWWLDWDEFLAARNQMLDFLVGVYAEQEDLVRLLVDQVWQALVEQAFVDTFVKEEV